MYYMKDLEQLTWQGRRMNWNEERLGEYQAKTIAMVQAHPD